MYEVSPLAHSGGRQHRYSCVTCRQRKVKCDRSLSGCINCGELGIQCLYAARKPRNSQRVRRDAPAQRGLLPTLAAKPNYTQNLEPDQRALGTRRNETEDDLGDEEEDLLFPREMSDASFEARNGLKPTDQGRLFVTQGKSRYLNADKVDQVASLVAMLNADSHSGETPDVLKRYVPLKGRRTGSTILSTSIGVPNLRSCYPSPSLMIALWDVYAREVDPVLKVLHKESTRILVDKAVRNPAGIDAPTEALLCAIWLAAVTAMSSESCMTIHGEERNLLVGRYSEALEKALARANWMTTQSYSVLQALILLITFHPPGDSRSTWMLTGMGVNLAQAMGLHSDAASFDLDPIETEVRRRIWWTLCQLDYRIADDGGLEPHIVLTADTQLPMMVNDADLDASAPRPIAPRQGCSEMTFPLIRMEFAKTILNIKKADYLHPTSANEIRKDLARQQISRYENVYMKFISGTERLQQLWNIGTRLLIAKLWKIALVGSESGSSDREELRERLLSYNTDVLETAHQLPDRLHPYGWSFRCKYTRWHAMAHLLVELTKKTEGPVVHRAWEVLEKVFSDLGEDGRGGLGKPNAEVNCKTRLWPPLLRLLKRARAARDQARAARDQARQLRDAANTETPISLQATPESATDQLQVVELGSQAQMVEQHDGLLGDPFFGADVNGSFPEDMDWDQLDQWVLDQWSQQDFQNAVDFGTPDMQGAMTFW